MIIPVLAGVVVDVHVADALFHEAAGEEAAVAEGRGAVFGADRFGLLAEVEDVESLKLHAVGGFHGLDAAFEEIVGTKAGAELAVEGLDGVELAALGGGVEPLVLQVGDHLLGLDFGVGEGRALVFGGEEAAAEERTAAGAAGAEGDESGEVLILRAEAVGEPGAEAGAGGEDGAGVDEAAGGGVGGVERVHRADDADVVDDGAHLGKKLAEFDAGLAVFGELEGTGEEAAGLALGAEVGGARALAGELFEGGLVVEHVDLRGAAGEEEEDDVLGFAGSTRTGIVAGEGVETDGAEATGELMDELAAGDHGWKSTSLVASRTWASCSMVAEAR